MKLSQILAALGVSRDDDLDVEDDVTPPAKPARTPAAVLSIAEPIKPASPSPEMVQLKAELDQHKRLLEQEREARLAEARGAFVAQCEASAATFCEGHKDRLNARSLTLSRSLLARLAQDDRDHPADGFSRAEAFQEVVSLAATQPHTRQVAANGKPAHADPQQSNTTVLSNGGDGGFEPREAARKQNEKFLGRKATSNA